MPLPTKTFDTLNSDQTTAIESASSQLTNFTIGSILRAIVESNSSSALWLQSLAAQLLAICRLTTSSGSDVDTFVNPFGYFRLPASPATGNVTLSRFSATTAATIPFKTLTQSGAQVSAPSISQIYSILPDPDNIYYNAGLSAYLLPIGIASITVPAAANVGGTAGNVAIGLINTINSVISGIDTVTNSGAFANGTDQQTDQQVKNDFPIYLAGLSKSTYSALVSATLAIPEVKRFNLVENKDYMTNTEHLGYFFNVVDDGSGSPPMKLLNEVNAAMEVTRAFTIRKAVFAPTTIPVVISVSINVVSGSSEPTITAAIKAALLAYINDLPFGATLFYTKIIEIIYNTDPAILNVTSLLVNAGTADLTSANYQIFLITNGDITITYI